MACSHGHASAAPPRPSCLELHAAAPACTGGRRQLDAAPAPRCSPESLSRLDGLPHLLRQLGTAHCQLAAAVGYLWHSHLLEDISSFQDSIDSFQGSIASFMGKLDRNEQASLAWLLSCVTRADVPQWKGVGSWQSLQVGAPQQACKPAARGRYLAGSGG
jgi:hypothetical protein